MAKARWRKRLRTAVLGVVAFVALIWGAVDIVGVPADNLWRHLRDITLGIVAVIALAAVPAGLLHWRRSRRD